MLQDHPGASRRLPMVDADTGTGGCAASPVIS
jgi:hypothetical protein